MAALHLRAFAPERGWTTEEFMSLLQSPHVSAVCQAHGFALFRTVAGEAELLTLAVDPAHRRKGIARALMRRWMRDVSAETVHLEVAADNASALALYAQFGFVQKGRRKAYYARPGAPPADALLMQRALTPREGRQSPSRS
jgi:ribosomal-protein-alanine N-acetyltransferase